MIILSINEKFSSVFVVVVVAVTCNCFLAMKQKRDILPFLVHPALIPIKVVFSEIAGFF